MLFQRLINIIDREMADLQVGATDSAMRHVVGRLRRFTTKAEVEQAKELQRRFDAATQVLQAHDHHAQRKAVVDALTAGSQSVADGSGPVHVEDIEHRYAEARQQSRAALEAIGMEAIALFLAVAPRALEGVTKLVTERVASERGEAEQLGIPYVPGSATQALWDCQLRLERDIKKLTGCSPRSCNPSGLLGVLGMLELPAQPKVRPWPPEPVPLPPGELAPTPTVQLPPAKLHFELRAEERQRGGGGSIGDALGRALGGQ